MNKRFILNADDFGLSAEHNKAVLEGFRNGFLTSASVCTNGAAFDSAVRDILPQCPGLGLGIHLNIIEGPALAGQSSLTGRDGNFKGGFFRIFFKSLDRRFLRDVEGEFRAQIEAGKNHMRFDHVDSHVHVHAIPPIFKIAVSLAGEYGIPFVRTQYEKPYSVPFRLKRPCFGRILNLLKVFLLNSLTPGNKRVLRRAGLAGNDFIIGVGYTGMMDDAALEYGLGALGENSLTEALIHPGAHPGEYRLMQNRDLAERIRAMGFRLCSYRNCAGEP
ncbi:MAG: ChbG/HpnK family deacetylase [Treponema sp.]|jgi:hypothetical protein|nr:ChbG/HpnK family deacetylase [Treponema sp.]